MSFSHWCGWGFCSAGMWCCVTGWVAAIVWTEHGAMIFICPEVQEECKGRQKIKCLLIVWVVCGQWRDWRANQRTSWWANQGSVGMMNVVALTLERVLLPERCGLVSYPSRMELSLKIWHFVDTAYFFVLCGSQNKQQLFPCLIACDYGGVVCVQCIVNWAFINLLHDVYAFRF